MADESGNGATATREFTPEVIEMGDKLATLTVTQAQQLGDYLEEKYGIKPAGGVAIAAGPVAGGGGDVAEAVEEQTEFDVVLEEFGAEKIKVIKVVREITGLGLKEAKEVVEGAPKPIKEKVSKEDADKFKKQLEDVGAKVSIK